MGGWRDSHFMIHRCDVQRATIVVDVTNIRDRRISAYATVEANVPCWFEHHGASLVRDGELGRIGVDRYSVYFEGRVDVQINDRLLKGSTYYVVEDVQNYSEEHFHRTAIVRKQGYAQT